MAALLALPFLGCHRSGSEAEGEGPDDSRPDAAQTEAGKIMQQLWAGSPLVMSIARQNAFLKLQGYADNCSNTYFKSYLGSLDSAAEAMEKYDPVLTCYRLSFDRVLDGIKNERVEQGTAVIWMLYNMGYVIKTPSACFALDISHHYATKLEPYLDFICVSHNHSDHYSAPLMNAMYNAGKPVLSNFFKNTEYVYTSKSPANYTIGKCSVRTAVTDHNSTLLNFVTVSRIDCGEDAGHFTLVHVGDSNYKPAQYANVHGPVNLLIPRYAPSGPIESNIIGAGTGQVQPDCALLSHIMELGHASAEDSRWTLDQALARAAMIRCDTYVPFWGEKLVWKNGKLN